MKIQDVIEETKRLTSQHGEVTVRQVYYQLYPKFNGDYETANSFYTSFDRMLVDAREDGDIPVNKVIDTARDTMGGDFGFTSPKDFLESEIEDFLSLSEDYTRKRWANQPVTPVVWIEKDALSRIVHDVAKEYRVMTCPSRGYSSMHYLWKIANRNSDLKILHFADHDPSGIDMTRDLKERVAKYTGKKIPVERIALTYEQVEEFDLAPNPTKSADTRRGDYVEEFGDKCWELDALPPDELKRLVRESLEKEIDKSIWQDTIEKEKKERKELENVVGEVKDELEDLAEVENLEG